MTIQQGHGEKSGMNKILNRNIGLRELLHYRKDLRAGDSVEPERAPAPDNFCRQVRMEYHARIPNGLFEGLGISSHHQIDEYTSCLAAYHQNELIGCKLFNLQGKANLLKPFTRTVQFPPGHLYGFGLFVKPEFRGKGVGKLLNLEAFKLFRDTFACMDILIDAGNYISIRNDEQLGFQKIKTYVFLKTPLRRFVFSVNGGVSYAVCKHAWKIAKSLTRPIVAGIPRLSAAVIRKACRVKNELFLTSYAVESAQTDAGPRGIFICRHIPDPVLLNKIYPQGCRIRKDKTFRRDKMFEESDRHAGGADFIVADVRFRHVRRRLSGLRGVYIIPKWVGQKNANFNGLSDFSGSRKNDASRDIRLTSKYNYDYEFTKNEAILRFFYDRMYCPYMHARYPDEKVVVSFDYIRKEFLKGGLVMIKDMAADKYVAGSVVNLQNNTLTAVKLGVLDGDPDLLRKRAVSALYISYFKFMEKNNIRKIHLGASRSFLNDGVLKYKAKWGTVIDFDKRRGNVFILRICRPSEYMDNFLANNPFISLENDKMAGNVFIDVSNGSPEREESIKNYQFKGLSELRLIPLMGGS